jgi:hypothetical protein
VPDRGARRESHRRFHAITRFVVECVHRPELTIAARDRA